MLEIITSAHFVEMLRALLELFPWTEKILVLIELRMSLLFLLAHTQVPIVLLVLGA